jgi:hypothetical protein
MDLGMIAARDDQRHIRKLGANQGKSFEHELETLVSSPLAEREDAMGIATTREIRILRTARQNAVSPHVHVVAAVFVGEDLAIAGHQYRHGVGEQQHARGEGASQAIGTDETNADVFEIDGIHEMVQGDVGVAAAQTSEQRNRQAGKSTQRMVAESAEEQIEPRNIGLEFAQDAEQPQCARRVIRRPAAHDGETGKFALRAVGRRKAIAENGEIDKRIALQFLSDVQPVLAQPSVARRKSGYQANFHSSGLSGFMALSFDEFRDGNVGET